MANPALNTNIVRSDGDLVRLRFEIQETAAVAISTGFELRYSYNGGIYQLVGAGAEVQPADSAMFVDGDPTTNVLPSGTGAFEPGIGSEDETVPAIDVPAGGHTEIEFAFYVGAQGGSSGLVFSGDTLDLRVYKAGGTPLDAYDFTPRITVT